MDLYKLQNGSDIRGVAIDGVAGEEVNFPIHAAEVIAGGFLLWLREEKGMFEDSGRPFPRLHFIESSW